MKGPSRAIGEFIIDTLKADPVVSSLVSDRISDHRPDTLAYPCITLGPNDFLPEDAGCIMSRRESVQIDIWSQRGGNRREAQDIVDAVCTALRDVSSDLGDWYLHSLRFTLARVFSDPDPEMSHGVVSVEAVVEVG